MSEYLYSIGATAAIFTLLALSLNIITGYAGQAMMGHAAFFGIGAYTAAILTQTYHVNFFLALLIAMLFTGACGALLGLISLRLQADFLAITTIGINFVMVALFNNMSITGGFGFTGGGGDCPTRRFFAAAFPGLGKGGFSVRAGRSPASRKKEKPGRCAGLALPPCAVSGADQAERTHKRQAPALPAADRPNTDGGEPNKQQAADAERRGNDQRKLPRDQRADRVQDRGQQQISHLEQHKVHAADRMAVRKRRGTGRKIGNEAKQAQIGERCHSPVF